MRPLENLNDATLVERARSEPDAFGELYHRYVDRIYNYIYYRVGSHEEAEDLTARTFFQALDNLAAYEDRGAPFSAWLYRIAHNLVANWHRHHSRHRTIPLEDPTLVTARRPGPGYVVEANETREELLQAIHRLPADRQQLLILKFVEHMPNAQIGQIMGRTESSIKSLYHRTLLSLRTELEDRNRI